LAVTLKEQREMYEVTATCKNLHVWKRSALVWFITQLIVEIPCRRFGVTCR